MKIHEHQAKEVLAGAGIAVPRGQVCVTPEQAAAAARQMARAVVVKAQVHTGGRGKAGGVKLARSPEEARQAASDILGMQIRGFTVRKVLVEEAADIRQEFYLGITLDRARQRSTLIASAAGGMDIEETAATAPEKIARVPLDPVIGLRPWHALECVCNAGFPGQIRRQAAEMLGKLAEVYFACDATLAEINPLVLTGDGTLLATDAKLMIDDNALWRQKDLAKYQEEAGEDEIEVEAHRRGVQYVRLEGGVGVIGNGAGLVMATLDEVGRAGGHAANFLDIGGGARAELVRDALEIVLMNPAVRCVFFNVFGGITRGDEVARGILEAYQTMDVRVPVVIRLTGTAAAEGRALLEGTPLVSADTMQQAAARAVSLAGGAA